ncbi:MAG: DUF2156 domain-containing protein [Lachnospiraceae bacterium]|nr:DUF2156 domain-containing protein [Lachnospiraceae bacterium]
MDYKRIELDNIKEIAPFFRYAPWRTCDFTIGGLFMWRDFYKMEYCVENDTFFSRLRDANDNYYYNLPLSANIEASLRALMDSAPDADGIIRFCTVPEACLELFSASYNVQSSVKEYNLADYLYLSETMCTLSGRKLSGQRNQIHQFERDHPSWSFAGIDGQNLSSVRDFFLNEYHMAEHASACEKEENEKVLEVLSHYDTYGLRGGVLSLDGHVIGFSIGEILGDTIYIHIEKAAREIKGAYQLLTNQFLKLYCSENVMYVNREEDMGDEGLRKSKNAYHPLRVLKKYTVEIRNR